MSTQPVFDLYPFVSDDDAVRVVAFHNRAYRELAPRKQDATVEEFRARNDTPTWEMHTFGIEDAGGDLEALGIGLQWLDGTNEHLQFVQMFVRPESRCHGLARRLLEYANAIAVRSGRTMLLADTYDTVPSGESFAIAVGAQVGMRERISVIDTRTVDREMLESWRQEGPGRAPGYEVLQWEDTYPEEHHGQIARLFVIADEDMPFEDAAFDPAAETAETVRERLERTAATYRRVAAVARHVESGELAGFSEIIKRGTDTSTLYTSLTVVHRDHRGHALGKWIKADAILRAMERWPGATHIQTENAFTNDAMLGINEAIGFEAEHTLIAYQATTDQISAYLDSA